nr:ADP-ribosylation factor-binding protein GGA2-like isoform X1 [Dermatophagoides farinae]
MSRINCAFGYRMMFFLFCSIPRTIIRASSMLITMQSSSTIKTSVTTNLELTELDICLARCTNPLTRITDELIDQLCLVTNSQTNGPYTTLKFLAYKAQSPQESEALHSLRVLELVAKRGGYRIADELGKFRFLNEIIKIVSPKYLAHQTSAKVGQRIIELIFQWSMDFKELPKIFEAYQMLKVQKIVHEDPVHVLKNYRPPTPPKPRPKHEIFDDEQTVKTLRSLIESGRAENLEAANQMIKNLALKAESRDQFKANFGSELESARNCAHLLNEMVAQSNTNLKIDSESKRILYRGTTDEDMQLMRELLCNCETIRFRLYRFSNQITENDHEELRQLIEVSDMLMSTINSCKRYFILLDDPKLLQTTNDSYDDINDNNRSNPVEEERLLDLNTTPLTSPKRISLENIDDLDYSLDDNGSIQESMLRDLMATTTLNNTRTKLHIHTSTSDNSNLHQLADMFGRQNLSTDQQKINHKNGKMASTKSITLNQQSNKEFTDLSELLASINQICYEDIQPCREMRPPLLVFNDDGLVVNLHFTGNNPHQQVSVFLLTFTNYNRSTITDIHFWAAVPKRMKVKLQYQTGSTLPGLQNGQDFPETFISQVMLIACDQSYYNNDNDDIVNQQQHHSLDTIRNLQQNSSLMNIENDDNDDHDHDHDNYHQRHHTQS